MALSYAHRSWGSVKLQYETDTSFQREFVQAGRILAGERKQDFSPQTFCHNKTLELILEKPYIVFTEDQFLAKFEIPAKEVPGLAMDVLRNERGEAMKCIILQEPDSHYRLYARSVVATDLGTVLQSADSCYRAKQGADLAAWYEADTVKQRPAGLKTGMTVSSLQSLIDKTKLEKAQRAQSAAEPGAAEEGAAANAEPEVLEVEEEEEEEEEEVPEDNLQLAQVMLPSAAAAAAAAEKSQQKKRKQQEAAGRRLRQKQSVGQVKSSVTKAPRVTVSTQDVSQALSQLSRASSPQRCSASVGAAASMAGQSLCSSESSGKPNRPSASPWKRLIDNAEKYMEIFSDMSLVLSGKSIGNHTNNALRELEAVEKTRPGCPEGISLRAKRDLVLLAQTVVANNLSTLPKEERQRALTEVMPNVVASEIPLQFQIALLSKVVSEMHLDTPKAVCDWSDAVLPVGALTPLRSETSPHAPPHRIPGSAHAVSLRDSNLF